MPIYKAIVYTLDDTGRRNGTTTFELEAVDFDIAKPRIKNEIKRRKLPPVRAMAPKAAMLESGCVEVLVYLQDPMDLFPRDIDVQWKAPVGATKKGRKL